MDYTQFVFFKIETVRRLVKEREKNDRYRKEELIVAIFLGKFFEKIWSTECDIGFPVKDSESGMAEFMGHANILELKNILNSKIKQDHDIDTVIVKHTPKNSDRFGKGFQIKTFAHQSDLTTDGLVNYIKSLTILPKTKTALVILLATGLPTKFTEIRNAIDFKTFPFSNLYLIGLYNETLKFIEIWPALGKEELKWSLI